MFTFSWHQSGISDTRNSEQQCSNPERFYSYLTRILAVLPAILDILLFILTVVKSHGMMADLSRRQAGTEAGQGLEILSSLLDLLSLRKRNNFLKSNPVAISPASHWTLSQHWILWQLWTPRQAGESRILPKRMTLL